MSCGEKSIKNGDKSCSTCKERISSFVILYMAIILIFLFGWIVWAIKKQEERIDLGSNEKTTESLKKEHKFYIDEGQGMALIELSTSPNFFIKSINQGFLNWKKDYPERSNNITAAIIQNEYLIVFYKLN